MCKKLLSGLLGGGAPEQKTPAAAPTAAAAPDAETSVKKDTVDINTRNPGMLTQTGEDRKRRGVPGLGL